MVYIDFEYDLSKERKQKLSQIFPCYSSIQKQFFRMFHDKFMNCIRKKVGEEITKEFSSFLESVPSQLTILKREELPLLTQVLLHDLLENTTLHVIFDEEQIAAWILALVQIAITSENHPLPKEIKQYLFKFILSIQCTWDQRILEWIQMRNFFRILEDND